jgi:ATP-binding cassette subfamily C (CFTR/MRP) protein 2
VVAVIAAQYILIPLPIILIAGILLYRYSIQTIRETARIESLTKSPLLSYISESLSGLSTIRSFDKQQ